MTANDESAALTNPQFGGLMTLRPLNTARRCTEHPTAMPYGGEFNIIILS